jgi:hypothetical protein
VKTFWWVVMVLVVAYLIATAMVDVGQTARDNVNPVWEESNG